MKIYTKHIDPWKKKFIRDLLEIACEELNKENLSLSIVFVGEKEIQKLNNKFRNVNKVTDVLSFPMEEEGGIDFPNFEEDLYIGDIVICTKRAKEQAKMYGHSYKRELAFLSLHGFLHLLGYDHIEKADEELMMSVANKILNKANIRRENV